MICPICNTEFHPTHKNQKVCSNTCRGRYRSGDSKETRLCEMCNKEFVEYKIRARRFCSTQCRTLYNRSAECNHKRSESVKNTFNEKFGTTSIMSVPSIQNKSKKTKLERYGNENYVNVAKAELTKLKKYGDVHYNNPTKMADTKYESYGDSTFNNRDKFKKTMNSIYGGIGTQRPNVLDAAIAGSFNKLGVQYALQSSDVRRRASKTIVKKYGRTTYWGSPEWKDTMRIKKLAPLLKIMSEQGIAFHNCTYTISKCMYSFICTRCNTIFNGSLASGNIPLCPKCHPKHSKYTSTGEIEVGNFVESIIGSDSIIRNCKRIIPHGEIDIYIPSKKLAIEYNGLFWHSQGNGKDKNYHLNKTAKCEVAGIRLIHIFEDEWKFKRHIVESKLKHILGKDDGDRIFARNTIIRPISASIKNDFLNIYHIQGADKSRIHLGAFYNNILVGVMTFSSLRPALGYTTAENDTYELSRFCTSTTCVGLGSKMFTFFIKSHHPIKIVSYADRRWSTAAASIYERLGFKLVSTGQPNYWYMDDLYLHRKHRFSLRKSVMKKSLKRFSPDLTEWQNAQLNDFDRIWDCGSLKYEWKL